MVLFQFIWGEIKNLSDQTKHNGIEGYEFVEIIRIISPRHPHRETGSSMSKETR